MSRRRKIASVAFTGAAAAAVMAGNAPRAAAASGTWTLNQPNGTGFTGVNVSPALLVDGGIPLICADGTVTATGTVLGNGKSDVPQSLFTLTGTLATSSQPCSVLGWGIDGHIATAAFVASQPTTSSGVTKGRIHISYSWTGVNGYICHMQQAGSEPASFSNQRHQFAVGKSSSSPLTITSVSGCLGLYTSGEHGLLKTVFATSPSLTITGG